MDKVVVPVFRINAKAKLFCNELSGQLLGGDLIIPREAFRDWKMSKCPRAYRQIP